VGVKDIEQAARSEQHRPDLAIHACARHSHAVTPRVCVVALGEVPRLVGVTPPSLVHPLNLWVILSCCREELTVVVKLCGFIVVDFTTHY
jgi:hypothetical protein